MSTSSVIQHRNPNQGSIHLDALRGAAALLVFLNHTRALFFSPVNIDPGAVQQVALGTKAMTDTWMFGEIRLASEAVVIFFVLSGYLVGGSVLRSIQTSKWSWKVYMTKRLTRLWVVLIRPC